MRKVIIGSSGYIGKNLVNKLISENNEKVYLYDIKDGKNTLNYNQLYEFLKEIKPEIVYHLANHPAHLLSKKYPKEFIHNNFLSTLNVAECARLLNFRIVFASSASIYGNQEVPWSEPFKPEIDSPYSFAKVISENLLKEYYEKYQVLSTICRISSPYGGKNEESHQPEAILSKFIREAKEGKKIIIYGVRRTRDWTHIDDLIEGILVASRVPGFNIFNISSGKEYRFEDVVKKLTDNYEIRPLKELDDDIAERWCCSNFKLQLWGFEPKINLMDYLDKVKNEENCKYKIDRALSAKEIKILFFIGKDYER